MNQSPYTVMVNGVPVQCQTPEDVVRLTGVVANGVRQTPPAPPSGQAAPLPSIDTADEVQSKWTAPAKRVIALLVGAGPDGVDLDQIVKVAGLKGSKGSGPVLKEIIKLLGVDNGAVDRPRAAADGKKRWVLKPRGARAAAKLGLIEQS